MSRDDHELSEHRELFEEVDDILERSWARTSNRKPSSLYVAQAIVIVVVAAVAAVLIAPTVFPLSAALVVAAVFGAGQRISRAEQNSGTVTEYLASLWVRSWPNRGR